LVCFVILLSTLADGVAAPVVTLYGALMKIPCIIFSSFLLAGCSGSHPGSSLTAEQARTRALQLANDKASADFHCQPFHDGQPAQFVAGYWVWTDRAGYGEGDFEARVELAPDGSAHKVELQLLDNRAILHSYF
jgi:hypothetical protein